MASSIDMQVERLVLFLSNSLEAGSAPILWVGAGASAAAGFPALGRLEEILRKRLPGVAGDAYQLVDAYVEEYSRADLAQLLQKHLGIPRPFAPIHEAIARLAAAEVFPFLFTTNYDRLLENALSAAQTSFVVQSLQDNYELQTLAMVQVLKLHGDLGNWMDVVLTSYSYREFQTTYPLLKNQLDQSLRTRPVVFVGCSMTDPRLIEWLQGLTPSERSRLFASRAILTDEEWGRLPDATRELLGSASIKPILVPDHAGVTRLFQEAAVRLAPLAVVDLLFDLEPGADEWTVVGPTPESRPHTVANPLAGGELLSLLADLRESVGHPVRLDAPDAPAVEENLEALALQISSWLTPVLLSGTARQEVLRRIDQVDRGRPRLVIRVRDESALGNQALSLPWELLAPRPGELVVRQARLDVVREAVRDGAPSLPEPTGPLTVAVTVAAPEDLAVLNYERESFRLQGALTGLGQQAAFSDLGGVDDLVEVVVGQKAAAVHFSGHGQPGALVFEDGQGFAQIIPISEVVRRLNVALPGPETFPRLFFLASCHGATETRGPRGDVAAALGRGPSTAATLHRSGFVQVVGYFGPVGDELCTRAEETFYRALAEGKTTLHAAAAARASLADPLDVDGRRIRYPLAWAQLVLYHRGPDRPVALPDGKGRVKLGGVFQRRTVEVGGLPVLEHGFIGRRGLQHEIRRRVERDGQRLIVLQGLGGLGKTALASQLLSRTFAPDSRDQLILRGRGLEEKADPIAELRAQAEEHGRIHRLPQWEERRKRLREEIADPASGFAATVEELRRDRPGLVLYMDNAEPLQEGPRSDDPKSLGSWRPEAVEWWAEMEKLAANGLVLISTRYGWKGLSPGAWVPVDPLSQADVLRMLDTFPGFRPLARRDRERLAAAVDGHPRTLEILDRLIEERAADLGPGFEARDPWTDLIEPVLPRHAQEIRADLLLKELWQRITPAAREHAVQVGVLRVSAPRFVIDRLGAATPELIRTGLLTRFREQMLWEDRTEWLDRWGLQRMVRSFVRSKAAETSLRSAQRAAGEAYEEWVQRPGASWSDQEEGVHHLQAAGEGDRAWPMLEKLVIWLRGEARYRDALSLLETCEASGATGDRLAMALMLRAQMRRDLGERSLDLAETLDRALELASSDETRALVLGEQGSFRLDRQEHSQAASLLRRALVLKGKTLGREHPEYGASLHELAGVLAGQGDYAEAEDLLRQALDLQESPQTLTNLADVLAVQGRGEEGEPLILKALAIVRKKHGEEHPAVAHVLTVLARLQATLGRPEAAATARLALKALAETLGPEHPATRQGEAVLHKILAGGSGFVPIAQLRAQARIAAEKRDFPAAIAAQERAVALAREAGEGREALVTLSELLYWLAAYLGQVGRYDEALGALEEVVALDERTGHPDLESHRQDLEMARRFAARAPEEREELSQQGKVAAQIKALVHKVRDDAIAALRGEEDWDDSVAAIAGLAENVEGLGSGWRPLALYLRAVLAILLGREAPEVHPDYEPYLAAIEAAARG